MAFVYCTPKLPVCLYMRAETPQEALDNLRAVRTEEFIPADAKPEDMEVFVRDMGEPWRPVSETPASLGGIAPEAV